MPQPATHYLVTRRAIPSEYWSSWWDRYKPYFGLGSSAPDLFYFPLMPDVKNIDKKLAWEDIAGPLHSCRSYDMFCTLLTKSKQSKLLNRATEAEKQAAFSIGYYCHVITDCVFHPYVYRSTGDHWNSKDFSNELAHKKQEFSLDTGLFQNYYNKEENFSRIQWRCEESNGLLDHSIARLFNDAIQEIYPDSYPMLSDISDEKHPIQQAYSALVQSITTLFEGAEIHLFGQRKTIDMSELRLALPTNFFTSPYPECPTLDSYTPEELFNFSTVACRKIFLSSLSFLESDITNAKEFFSSHSTQTAHYINAGNWNLDTGLPCQYNNYKAMRDENNEHYAFKVNELKNIYLILRSEYNELFK